MIEIKIQQLSKKEIESYLELNSSVFVPSLLNRVDIKEFSLKICEKAIHFCAFDQDLLVGFLAAYFNHPQREFGYITSFSIINSYQNQGIATKLLEQVFIYARKQSFRLIKLEVNIKNTNAIRFYKKRGFKLVQEINKSYFFVAVAQDLV